MKKEKTSESSDAKVTLRDGRNLSLKIFGRRDKELEVSMISGGGFVGVPRFVYFSKSNYGFDKENGMLVKRCNKCGEWFAISMLLEDGIWKDIHNPNEVYFDETRFRSDCNNCYNSSKSQSEVKKKRDKNKSDEKLHGPKKSSNEGLVKKSIHLSAADWKFIHILKAIDDVAVGDVFSAMINKERKERSLKF